MAEGPARALISASSRERREWILGEVYESLRKLANEWAEVPDAKNLVLKPLKGAMTNHVYECRWPHEDGRTRRVLVRVYGEGCDLFFKRDDEIQTFERMSHFGQGPRLLARFSYGRIEEFLSARTLTAVDLRDAEISVSIALKLRQFHDLDIPGHREPQLWNRIEFWFSKALEICPQSWHEEFQLEILKAEVLRLERRLAQLEGAIGFCHNDLQYGNIMLHETNGDVTIIDYEYASFNPIAFDIANHFCEMMANYHTETPHFLDSSKYPGVEERSRFIATYLGPSDAARTKELLEEVEIYTLASHIHWGLWGMLSATFSEIEFDYLEYARQRFHLYSCKKPLLHLGNSFA